MTSPQFRKGAVTSKLLRLFVGILVILSCQVIRYSARLSKPFLTEINSSPLSSSLSQKPPLGSTVLTCGGKIQDELYCQENLPNWMQNYFEWHKQQLLSIEEPSDWENKRVLVARCYSEDRCGGTADRLKGLPLYLALAAKTQRLFFIDWTRPFPLQSFMLPNLLNWTIPYTLARSINSGKGQRVTQKQVGRLVQSTRNPEIWLVEGVAQVAGNDMFRTVVAEIESTPITAKTSNPSDFFHDMFLALFRPTPDLQSLVDTLMQRLNLQPNRFVTAHIRAKYPGEPYRETWNVTLLQQSVVNAVRCAASLAPDLPVYVAGDTLRALEAAQDYGRRFASYPVVSHIDVESLPKADPPHLNFAQKDDPAEFFSIFADLFIMSQSQCVAFGAGGFGRFGSLTSFNSSCHVEHSHEGSLNNCLA